MSVSYVVTVYNKATVISAGKHGVHERALAPLHPDTRQAWEDQLEWDPDDYDEDQEPYTPDTDSLRRYPPGSER